jgi:hypothetical protein
VIVFLDILIQLPLHPDEFSSQHFAILFGIARSRFLLGRISCESTE